MATQRLNRLKAELAMLTTSPPPGIICWQNDENSDVIMAEISGPPRSPYEKGTFVVEVSLGERYPFTPPIAKFVTPIYHPNVDHTGRICLSGLKSKPSGTWNCSLNIAVILSAIRLLMGEPNLGDPLVPEIAKEYQDNYIIFKAKAEDHTVQHAVKKSKIVAPEKKNNDDDKMDTTTNTATCTSKESLPSQAQESTST